MTPEVDEALLSAYLDGEVTDEERRRAEQLLAENAACRQFYDELRSLRAAFAGLPRHQLSKDFSGRVLQEAERGRRSPGPDAALRIVRPPEREAARLRLPRNWRAWVWPVLAVAAALFMMLYPPEQPVAKIAKAPEEPPLPANLEIRAVPADKPAAAAPIAASERGQAAGMADPTPADGVASAPRLAHRKAAAMGAPAASPTPPNAPLDREVVGGDGSLAKAAEGVLLVEIVARSATAGQDALEQLLARHGIAAAPDGKGSDAKANQLANKTKRAPGWGAGEIQTEATHDQIEAALADLRQQVDVFSSVRVQAATDSILQQSLSAYSRDAAPLLAAPAHMPGSAGASNQRAAIDEKSARPSALKDAQTRASNAPGAAMRRREAVVEDNSAPLRVVFVLRTAEPAPATPDSKTPESK